MLSVRCKSAKTKATKDAELEPPSVFYYNNHIESPTDPPTRPLLERLWHRQPCANGYGFRDGVRWGRVSPDGRGSTSTRGRCRQRWFRMSCFVPIYVHFERKSVDGERRIASFFEHPSTPKKPDRKRKLALFFSCDRNGLVGNPTQRSCIPLQDYVLEPRGDSCLHSNFDSRSMSSRTYRAENPTYPSGAVSLSPSNDPKDSWYGW